MNNAGEQTPAESILDLTQEQLVRTFQTNIFSMFYLVKAALPTARGRSHREHHVGDRLSGLAEPAGLLGHEAITALPARSPRTKTS
ncbi:MAG: hypothetical protein ACLTMP_02635 [Eggerthella lenta]